MRRIVTFLVAVMLIPNALSQAQVLSGKQILDYYPPIEPYHNDFLKVSDLHEIYYEESGNPARETVFVLHGGPGGGSYPELRRYHNPESYHIVTYDQRGAGKSKPYNELKENNTPNLVEDIELLRRRLKLDKIHIFGGSWGSTLALAYAEKYPQNVSSLILRGIFLGTQREIDHFYHGDVGQYFPQVYAKLQSVLPNPKTLNYPQQFLDLLTGKDEKRKKEAARAWAAYETKVGALETTDEEVNSILDHWDPYNFSLIENYYMAHHCFLEEGQLLRDAGKLAGIPTIIVNGRYDVICPPTTAFELHQAIPGSRLVIVESAGHSGGAILMRSALIEAVHSLNAKSMSKSKVPDRR